MKLTIYYGSKPPVVIENVERMRVEVGRDAYEMRPSVVDPDPDDDASLLVRIEEHDERLALDLGVFPAGGNSIRLKGGVR